MTFAKQQILTVDDRPENLYALEKTLADTGAQVVKAKGGEEALNATLHHEFSLAILDVQMPGMDGYELAELLRGDPKIRHMPIIFLTAAFSEETQIFKGYESGAVDYIVKPYDPRILLSKVRVFLEMERNRKEIQEHRDHLDDLVAQRTAELQRVNQELLKENAERRRAEERLEDAVAALRVSNQELEQFAYVASHDLQEPLRMVASYTQLLARRYTGQLDEKADMYIEFAVEGAKRMQSLIHDLLILSRVGTRGKPPARTPSGEVLQEALKNLEVAIQEAQASVEIEGELPAVMADRTQLAQVFQNLVANAIKFQGEDLPVVTVSAERRGEMWAFTVADNGIGIDPKFHQRVFVIFQRLHERGKYPGTGIGLAVVRKIIDRHGGKIWVDSQEGSGAQFTFTLPAVDGGGGDTSSAAETE